MIKNDRKDRRGGETAILIKRNIEFKKVNIQSQQGETLLEHTIVKIKIKANTLMILVAIYALGGDKRSLFRN